jgi:hypothetical protein
MSMKPDSNDRVYWRGFTQLELDIIIEAIRDNFLFQIYLRNLGFDIRKFGDIDRKEEYFECTIRRIIAEELERALMK